MTEAEFEALIDRYGHSIEDWPGNVQSDGRLLLVASPAARAVATNAQQMHQRLDALRVHHAPSGLVDGVVEALPSPGLVTSVMDWLSGAVWRPALAAAAPAVIGFIIGAVTIEPATTDPFLEVALTEFFAEVDLAE